MQGLGPLEATKLFQAAAAYSLLGRVWIEASQAAVRPGSDSGSRRSKSNAWDPYLGQAVSAGPEANNPLLSDAIDVQMGLV